MIDILVRDNSHVCDPDLNPIRFSDDTESSINSNILPR